MRVTEIIGRRLIIGLAIIAVGILVIFAFAFQPVTRTYVASEFVCSYCHAAREYSATARMPFSTQHPPELKEGQRAAQCVDCHVPEGFLGSAYMYTHALSATDLLGYFRDRASERAGDWIPPSAARAHRVRERLFENDSVTCRSCHIEAEIKPERKRGQRAHASALENKETCVECHDNLVHRYIEVRKDAFQ